MVRALKRIIFTRYPCQKSLPRWSKRKSTSMQVFLHIKDLHFANEALLIYWTQIEMTVSCWFSGYDDGGICWCVVRQTVGHTRWRSGKAMQLMLLLTLNGINARHEQCMYGMHCKIFFRQECFSWYYSFYVQEFERPIPISNVNTVFIPLAGGPDGNGPIWCMWRLCWLLTVVKLTWLLKSPYYRIWRQGWVFLVLSRQSGHL